MSGIFMKREQEEKEQKEEKRRNYEKGGKEEYRNGEMPRKEGNRWRVNENGIEGERGRRGEGKLET